MDKRVPWGAVSELIVDSYRLIAAKRPVKQLDADG